MNTLGVDLGAGTIKVIELSGAGKGIVSLNAIGETRNPNREWLRNPKAGEEVAAALKTLLWDLKIKEKKAVVCLPEDEVISRVVNLPPLKENEIRDALKFEAETFVPFPLDEVSIDYEIMETDESGRLTIYALASRNDTIQSYIKLMRNAGLELTAIESPTVAMRRLLSHLVSNDALTTIVDMGERYSSIMCLSRQNIYINRTIPVGGESLTRAISINLGLDMPSAEEYKKAYGLKETELEGKIKNSILPIFSNMAEEIRRAIVSVREEKHTTIELLMLSGGGANMPGLAEELTKILGIEVQVIQPFLKIDSSRITAPVDLKSDGCRFSLPVGLALRDLL